jgi:CRISPR/Cas system CSM-associated protein Csm2 small subunit
VELTKVRLSAQAVADGADISAALDKLKNCAECHEALRSSPDLDPLGYIADFFDDASLRELKMALGKYRTSVAEGQLPTTTHFAPPANKFDMDTAEIQEILYYLEKASQKPTTGKASRLEELATYHARSQASVLYAKIDKSDNNSGVNTAKNISYMKGRICVRLYNYIGRDEVELRRLKTKLTNSLSLCNTVQSLVEACGGVGILAFIPSHSLNKCVKLPLISSCWLLE